MSFVKHIQERSVDSALFASLRAGGADPLIARLYAARQVASADELGDNLSQLIHYSQLKNCTEAAVRLADAVINGERILIIADYDADGASACSVGMKGLAGMGARVDFFVPNRFEHGYGLTPELVDIAHERGTDLILTVDNGISSIEGVERAHELGIDVVITDHHSPGDRVPNCIIVNPNQRGCTFPCKSLAGVGVIFYVLIALRHELRQRAYFSERAEPNLGDLLDLVALGTVADVVALEHNNRILVSQGLKRIREGRMCHGIRALFKIARRDPSKAQAFDMGFALGPRINAAGRLDDMSVGIACLLAENSQHADMLAEQLNELNRSRQEIEQNMLQHILDACPDSLPEHRRSVCVYNPEFHQGVVGIVAGRLKERFYRPVFVFAPSGDGEIRGSGRSIPGFHLRDAVDMVAKRCPTLISKFGGHAMAAGLTMREDGFEEFQTVFDEVVHSLTDDDILAQTYLTDGSLHGSDITLGCARTLASHVWGQGFPQPSFNDSFRVVRQQSMGSEGLHTKAWLEKDGCLFEAMFWRFSDSLPAQIRAVYRPVVNEWRGNTDLQLYIDHWETQPV